MAFVTATYPALHSLLTVCTGAVVAARAGVLDGKKATTNKAAFRVFTEPFPDVVWQPRARWVRDGNLWTGAGVSAGIDVTLAWIGSVWGEEVAQGVADRMEYVWEKEGEGGKWDRFAELYGL